MPASTIQELKGTEHYKGSMMEGRVLCPRRSRLKLPLASSASLNLGSHLGLALLGAHLLSHFSVLRVKGGGQWAALNPRSLRAQKPRITLSLPALSHEIRQRCWSRLGLRRSVLYEHRMFQSDFRRLCEAEAMSAALVLLIFYAWSACYRSHRTVFE